MNLRLIGEETTLVPESNTDLYANTTFIEPYLVGNARAVRIFNDSGGTAVISRYDTTQSNTSAVVGTITMANNEVLIFDKNTTDALIPDANVKVTSVAFTVS
jgi:hypothetical protein